MPDETQGQGVVGLANRVLIDPADIDAFAAEHPLGAFFAFGTDEDAHTPVMLPVYDELVDVFEEQIPLFVVSVELDRADQSPIPRDRFLVFSVPTFIWLSKDGQILLRTVGTVFLRKLVKEIDDKIEELLDE